MGLARFPLVALLATSLAAPALAQRPPLPPDPSQLPLRFEESSDPARQQYDYYDFMWRSFIALNWPNVPITVEKVDGKRVITQGFRGEPDRTKSILGQAGAGPLAVSVWETYRAPTEIFLPPSAWPDYPEWNTPPPLHGGTADPAGSRPLMRMSEGPMGYAPDIAQPFFFPHPTGALVDRNGNYVRYEVAVNQAFFTYVRHFEYYNAEEQRISVIRTAINPRIPVGFQRPPFGFAPDFAPGGYLAGLPPFARQGLVDVKAAWRVLDPSRGDRPERYLHREIVVDESGATAFMGLVGLHILRYTPNGDGAFVAATFEQVDNTGILPGFSQAGLRPSFNTGAPPSEEQARLGFEGAIPSPTPVPDPTPVDVYRVTPLPVGDLSVSAANARYQAMLEGSVFVFYRMIGTQNRRPGAVIGGDDPGLNGHQGPITGVYTNTSELINTSLESYSQANFSCILCHVRARPLGVPIAAAEVDTFKILTFLLQLAQEPE